MEGMVLYPSREGMTWGRPSWTTAAQELEVPRSIPMEIRDLRAGGTGPPGRPMSMTGTPGATTGGVGGGCASVPTGESSGGARPLARFRPPESGPWFPDVSVTFLETPAKSIALTSGRPIHYIAACSTATTSAMP